MSTPYTHKQLTETEDAAAGFGIDDLQAVFFGAEAYDAEETGFSLHQIKPDKRQPFGHKHEQAEEVYVVIGGSGRVNLDGKVLELSRLDALRVAPGVTRAFEAGADGLELIAFGPRRKGDGEIIQGWWG